MDALGCALTPSHTQQWTIQNRSTANEKSVIQVDMQSARAESLLSRIGCPVKPHRVVGWCLSLELSPLMLSLSLQSGQVRATSCR